MRRNSNLPRFHEESTLERFTCFSKQTLNFVDDINIFEGENGTGKTYAMKVLYAVQKASAALRATSLEDELHRAFQTENAADFIAKGSGSEAVTRVTGVYGGQSWEHVIKSGDAPSLTQPTLLQPQPELPIFIPAIDMMGHSKGFLESANLVELDFDSTCIDLLAYLGSRRKGRSADHRELENRLHEIVQGDIVQDETKRFFLINEQGRFPMPMVAEGIRKIATLRKLVENNWLTRDTTLLWDEPEVNLNPKPGSPVERGGGTALGSCHKRDGADRTGQKLGSRRRFRRGRYRPAGTVLRSGAGEYRWQDR
jgi:hypothetical protein